MRKRVPSGFALPCVIAIVYWGALLVVSVGALHGAGFRNQVYVLALEACALPLAIWLAGATRRVFLREVRNRSSKDELTGLASRAFFMERVEEALARTRRNKSMVAVLFLDFDRFKRLNDTLGHAAGDKLLTEVARRLSRTVRGGELSARLGGDEFTVLLEGVREREGAQIMADRVLALMEKPFLIEGHEVLMTVSIGIALSEDAPCSADELVRRADVALYSAKAAGRNCWKVFDGKGISDSVEYLEMGAHLRAAVDQNELRVFFQPEVDLQTGAIKGFEALVRWQHPTRGLLAPGAFIQSAEESGFIRAIGKWVLRAACLEAVRWEKRFPSVASATVSVNVSPSEFGSREFVAETAHILAQTGLDPARLKLEITETALMQDLEGAMTTMHGLKLLGVKLAIDDFGTGYSSLSYLRRFPVDTLKIDQSFVRELQDDEKVRSIIKAIIVLAHALGVDVTAEGVETSAQLRFLMEANCDRAQGYLFARPLPAEALSDFLQAQERDYKEKEAVSLQVAA